jgi:hypothetical protein
MGAATIEKRRITPKKASSAAVTSEDGTIKSAAGGNIEVENDAKSTSAAKPK